MHVLIKLVRISDARHVESLRSADESPKRSTIGLSDDVGGDTVATSVPAGGDLSSHETAETDGLRNEDASTLLELDEPLAAFACPDVALVAVFVLVLVRLDVSGLEGLKVVDELDLLVEDLLLGVVAAEELGFYKAISNRLSTKQALL